MSDTKAFGLTIHDHGQQVPPDETDARKALEARYGKVWTTAELQVEFRVTGFAAPFVLATRKSNDADGSLEFTHSPRFYFGWKPDKAEPSEPSPPPVPVVALVSVPTVALVAMPTIETKPATAIAALDRIECRVGTYVSTLRAAGNAHGVRKIVVAWKGPVFRGAAYLAHYTLGDVVRLSLNEVCALFDVSPCDRKDATIRIEPPTKKEVVPMPKKITKPKPIKAAKPAAPAKAAPVYTCYTIGYDGGLTPAQLLGIVNEKGIGCVIDTRANLSTRIPGWSAEKLRAFVGTFYRTAQTLPEVLAMVAKAPTCILIRKEEAPGDNPFHLEIARHIKVTHIFRAETVEGAELQRAIDDGNEYDCEIKDNSQNRPSIIPMAIGA